MSYFGNDEYLIRRKIMKLFGSSFHVYDNNDQLVAFTKMKAFKLKEDLRMYTDEDMTEEIFCIKARSVIEFSAIYDVYDSKSSRSLEHSSEKG